MVPGKASMIRTKEAGKTPLLPPHSPLRQEDIVGLFQNLRRMNFPFRQQHLWAEAKRILWLWGHICQTASRIIETSPLLRPGCLGGISSKCQSNVRLLLTVNIQSFLLSSFWEMFSS